MYITLAGKRVLRSTYERYCPIASYMNWHPGKTVAEVAKSGSQASFPGRVVSISSVQMKMIRYILCFVAVLALCGCVRGGGGVTLSPAEYYDLGRYARQDEDWEGAVGYFEKALLAAEETGNDYYRGYACQQLSALWAMAYEYPTALHYARSSVVALEACGESAGACLSRLEMAWHYVYLGDEAAARALLEPLRAAFSSPDSPVAAYFAQLEDVLTRSAETGSFR